MRGKISFRDTEMEAKHIPQGKAQDSGHVAFLN